MDARRAFEFCTGGIVVYPIRKGQIFCTQVIQLLKEGAVVRRYTYGWHLRDAVGMVDGDQQFRREANDRHEALSEDHGGTVCGREWAESGVGVGG